MCTNTELKEDIKDLGQEQTLLKTQIKYLIDDVHDLKEMMKDVIKQQKKLERKMMSREQFFIDSVVEMKETLAAIIKSSGNGKKD
ncbi:hypothetical protein Calab_1532 [Caldithrix abyssi DSM 13497]|uniref:Uncharacterized protein n=2 Tax=Caldithrix abyssi TaxID=187145 RepID=H1XTC7_CALAY|nr:hypothetical protein [Caldithrix abyssi]APF16995.1 hypothetical protein Cabys_244 [Caldithrix abyssi DSM 13497]APF20316.1 hypothetical protein Cabys_3570 [Caldithrix abyssi DSM 13497]EHO40360.1 hypothetical protein Calab_0721 [Caldithrix abyssi DSM 13497]EHO41152.1 hypothetical protein Calab_1532 [Caldithrix abyssi DSM 13497]